MHKCSKNIARVFKDDLLKHSAILFSGMAVVNVCNLLFQMTVSRALTAREYALLTAFLGILTIISLPLATLTTGLSHYSSLLRKNERTGDVRRLLRKWAFIAGSPAVVIAAAVILFNESIAGFFHLDRTAPVIIAGATLPAMFCLPIFTGAAQGLQLFGWTSISSIAGAVLRLALGAGLVFFWVPACGWAMVGHGGGIYLSAAVLFFVLILFLRVGVSSGDALPSMRFYLLQSFFIQTAYAILMNADVILVKHFLPEETEFAYAATLGRTVAFIPSAIAVAMFPKVAAENNSTAEHRRVFMQSFFYTALLVFAAVACCLIVPKLLLFILFGIRNASGSVILLTRLMAVAMAFSALLNVVVQFLLAQRRFFKAWLIVFFCISYLFGVSFLHSSAMYIALFAFIFNFISLIALLVTIIKQEKRDE